MYTTYGLGVIGSRHRMEAKMRCSPILGLGILLLALTGCQSSEILQQENDLSAAGFTVRIADTAERQAMLNRLPPNRFVQRVNGNEIHYVYADPVECGCLYIGTQQDFAQFVSNQQLDFAQAQRIAFLNYYDAAWNWDAWGPWGPLGPIYGPGW
jgi:hypothetical protein